MKPNWKYVLVCLIIGWLLGAASGLLFCRARPFRHGPEHMAQRFSRQLQLTPEQEAKVRVIMADRRARMQQLREATQAEIRTLLTPQQQAELDRMHERRERRKRFIE